VLFINLVYELSRLSLRSVELLNDLFNKSLFSVLLSNKSLFISLFEELSNLMVKLIIELFITV
jgi:hypothetical protein